jgi:FixJ family two-component response regulator
MNEIAANRLREAMQRATEIEEVVQVAEELGRQAVTQALAERPPVIHNPIAEEERQRLLDAALGDAIETVNRHRMRLGRRVCSRPDASVTRQIYEALRSMADATGGADNDPSFS